MRADLQCERLVWVELYEQDWALVAATHGHALVVEAAVVERTNQIADALPLHADVGRQNVVTDLQKQQQTLSA